MSKAGWALSTVESDGPVHANKAHQANFVTVIWPAWTVRIDIEGAGSGDEGIVDSDASTAGERAV